MRELMKKKIENFQVLMEILESLFLLICLDLSHGLIVSEVLCQESFYGDYRRSFFLRDFWNCLPLEFFKVVFSVLLSAAAALAANYLAYSTMSDGIFLKVHRTFLLSSFRGCWIFFCARSMWTYNDAAIELTAAVIVKLIQQHGLEFREGTKPLAKKTF